MWTKITGSVTEFVESIKVMVDAIGINHDLLSRRVGTGPNRAWPGMTSGLFYAVAGEMLRQGFTAGEIGKVGGGDYCRVFGAVTAGKASQQVAKATPQLRILFGAS
jgi:membrane dipeptidase